VVTGVLCLVNHGLLQQLRYYSGDREIESELYDDKGILLRQSDTVLDDIVKEYYGDGEIRGTICFKDGAAQGKGIDFCLSGEILKENNYERGQSHGPSKLYCRNGML